ncbi:hypothetical protein ACPCHT_11150 [Nucisporomicrobium flavum]|uniref:hypothetical protein n=1 Tax=Nucisporomicrobium flavum TaxID=2785915 RepID=UPI003C2F72AC
MGRRTVRDLGVSAKVLTAVAVAALVALAVGDIKAAMLQARLTLGNHAISRDVATMAKYEEQFGRDLKAVEDAFVAYRGSAPAGDPAMLRELESLWQQYAAVARTSRSPRAAATTSWPGRASATPRRTR